MNWIKLVRDVIDDDDRTRRAGQLLWHVTLWLLLVIMIIGSIVAPLSLDARWTSAGAGLLGLVLAGRTRFRHVLERRSSQSLASTARLDDTEGRR